MLPAVSPLEAHLGYWLRLVSNNVSHAFASRVARHGVTVAEWVLLRALHDHERLAPSALADALGMTRGAISKLVDRLAAKGLVARAQGGADRRYQQLSLTADGRALVPELARLADANDAEFFGDLNPEETAALERLLKNIVRRRGITGVPLD